MSKEEFKTVTEKPSIFKKLLFFVAIGAGVLVAAAAIFPGLPRLYLSFFGPIRSEAAQVQIERFAGCSAMAGMATISDEEFAREWLEMSRIYSFTYEDVKVMMEQKCLIDETVGDVRSESYNKHIQWMKTLDQASYEREWKKFSDRIESAKKLANTSKNSSIKNSPF